MSRPDPIEYAERLYGAIRAANFSSMSFLAFGNAVKEGVAMRSMPRIAVEPFMRIVGEMLDLEEEAAEDNITDAQIAETPINESGPLAIPPASVPPDSQQQIPTDTKARPDPGPGLMARSSAAGERRRTGGKR
jgi:hypothetical protein